VGALSSQPSRPGDPGVEPAAAYLLRGGSEDGAVSRRRGRWWVDWQSVEPDTIPARAAAVLADRTLAKPLPAALLAFFVTGLDGARAPGGGTP
jgi:hypothetical protein